MGMKRLIGACLLLGAAIVIAPAAAPAANAFDGAWSVVIVTDKGGCDRGYRYDIQVANGQVRYSGDSSVRLAGSVAADGDVKVSLSVGKSTANGAGRLSATSGSGTWRGNGDSGPCSGHWEAERH